MTTTTNNKERVLYPNGRTEVILTEMPDGSYRVKSEKSGDTYSCITTHTSAAAAVKEYFRIARIFALRRAGAFDEKKQDSEYSPERFAVFWSAYPRKVGKKDCEKAFKRLYVTNEKLDMLLEAIEKQKQSEQWKKGVIPNGSTWLNGEKWNDELRSAEASADNDTRASYDLSLAERQAQEKPVFKKREVRKQ